MPWVVSGSCNHCGMCCYTERGPQASVDGRFPMTSPCINDNGHRCAFYEDNLDTGHRYGHCKILAQIEKGKDPTKVRDENGNLITQKQLDWFYYNCPEWPQRPKDVQQLVDGKWTLPSTCGFYLEWVD